MVWGATSRRGLRDLAAWLRSGDRKLPPLVQALTEAVVRFNSLPPAAEQAHRQRMALILRVPALQAHSTLQYASWRAVVADFAADRLGVGPHTLLPQLVAHAALAAALTAYEQWLADAQADLPPLLRQSFALLSDGLASL